MTLSMKSIKRLAIFSLILLTCVAVSAQGFKFKSKNSDKQPETSESSMTTNTETEATDDQPSDEAETAETTDTANVEDAATANPVVIQLAEQGMALDEFNARFRVYAFNLMAQQGVQPNEALLPELEAIKPQILEQFATDMVLMQAAQAEGLEVDNDAVDAQMEAIKASVPEEATLDVMLAQAGFNSEEQLRTLISESDIMTRFIEKIREDIEVDDETIQSFYEENNQEFVRPEEVCARHILVETEEEANALVSELADGKDFAELAAERSTGPSASSGGDLGCFSKGRMVPSFEEAAFAAELNQPTEPVQSDFGYHVILVYERNEEGMIALDTVSERIREVLVNEGISDTIANLYEESGIETFPELIVTNQPQEATASEGNTAEEATGEDNAEQDSTHATDTEDSSEDNHNDDQSNDDQSDNEQEDEDAGDASGEGDDSSEDGSSNPADDNG